MECEFEIEEYFKEDLHVRIFSYFGALIIIFFLVLIILCDTIHWCPLK